MTQMHQFSLPFTFHIFFFTFIFPRKWHKMYIHSHQLQALYKHVLFMFFFAEWKLYRIFVYHAVCMMDSCMCMFVVRVRKWSEYKIYIIITKEILFHEIYLFTGMKNCSNNFLCHTPWFLLARVDLFVLFWQFRAASLTKKKTHTNTNK